MRPRLLIVASHPIQYHAPWFRALQEDGRLEVEVLVLTLPDAEDQGVDFGRAFEWDVPLLQGYDWRAAKSASGGITGGYFSLRLRDPKADLAATAYDVILSTGWHKFGMLQCLRAAVASSRPVLVRAESNGLEPLRAWARLKSKWLLRGVSTLLPIGTANEQFYKTIGAANRVGERVPYFIDNDFFARRADGLRSDRAEIRRKFGIPEASTCFMFAGKLVGKKRPADILAALTKLQASHTAVYLLMVGSGQLEPELRQIVQQNDLPVHFAGFLNQSEMPSAYVAADCIVLPSDYGETWGLVVNEAMACGLPAIVSDRAGCGPDLIKAGETGYRFPFGDIVRLSEAMAAFSELDSSSQAEMGAAAERRVRSDCSMSTACEATVREVCRAVTAK